MEMIDLIEIEFGNAFRFGVGSCGDKVALFGQHIFNDKQ